MSVTTQTELDAAIAAGETWIDLIGDGYFRAYGSATVTASDSATVTAYDSATVTAYDSATVTAYDSATVAAYGSATVTASDSATVRAYGSATVRAYDSATVTAYGSATVTASDSATVTAYGSATVTASDSATVRASDSATVTAYGSATVRASDSATVRASDSATVTAYGSATVTASKYVSVHTTGSGITVVGGVIIAVPDVDEMTSGKEWCEYAGIPANGNGSRILYKAVDENLISGHGTAYHIGSTVTAEDFEDARRCGNGLHFSQSPHHANSYRSYSANSRFLAVKVRTKDLVILGNDKVKAPSCEVLYEVDINGNRLESSND